MVDQITKIKNWWEKTTNRDNQKPTEKPAEMAKRQESLNILKYNLDIDHPIIFDSELPKIEIKNEIKNIKTVKEPNIKDSYIKTVKEPTTPVYEDLYLKDSLYAWLNYLDNLLRSWFEYFYPIHKRDHIALDPESRRILEEQQRLQNSRAKRDRAITDRKQKIRKNHNQDVAKVYEKKKICTNWFDEEVSHLIEKRTHIEGIVPALDTDYSKTPGWDVKEGESSYRGHKDLCHKLACSEIPLQNQNSTYSFPFQDPFQEHKIKEQQTEIQNLKQNVEQYIRQNQQYMLQCKQFIQDNCQKPVEQQQNYYQSQNQNPQWNNPYQQNSYQSHNPNSQWDNPYQQNYPLRRYEVGSGQLNPPIPFTTAPTAEIPGLKILDFFANLILLPVQFLNDKAWIWRDRKPPILPVRFLLMSLAFYIWFKGATILFFLLERALDYAIGFLLEPPNKKKDRKEKEEAKSFKALRTLLGISGGSFSSQSFSSDSSESLTFNQRQEILRSVDPIFILIHIERARIYFQKSLTKPKLLKSIQHTYSSIKSIKIKKIKIKKEFLAYIGSSYNQ